MVVGCRAQGGAAPAKFPHGRLQHIDICRYVDRLDPILQGCPDGCRAQPLERTDSQRAIRPPVGGSLLDLSAMDATTDRRTSRLWAAMGVRGDEKALVGWMVALFAVTQSSHGVGANAADALFFLRYGVDRLPLMILLAGPAVMIVTLLHASGLSARGPARWLAISAATGAAWAGLEWVSVFFDTNAVYPVIWISTQVLITGTLTIMWNAAGAACTTRQAKRLFPIFATAGVAGGIVGNLLVGPLASLLGTQNLLAVQALLMLGSATLLVKTRAFFEGDAGAQSVRTEMTEALVAIRSSKLLKLASLTAFALFAVFFLVVFPFSQVVTASFATEAEVATFLGLFSSVATAATFLFSLLITNRLFRRLGIVISLMIVPLVYVGGFAAWLVTFGLVTAALVRGLQWVAVNAIQLTAFSALFNVLSPRRRGAVLAFITAVPAQLGTMAGGLILLASGNLTRTIQFMIALVISGAGLGVVIAMRPAYLTAVVSAVRRGLVGVFNVAQAGIVAPEDGDAVRILREHLDDPRPQARAAALSGLARLPAGVAAPRLEPLLEDESPLVRSVAFDSVCVLDPGRVSTYVTEALTDDSAEVRLNALRSLSPRSIPDLDAVVSPALGDPDPRVRAVAIALVDGEASRRAAEEMLDSDDQVALAAILEQSTRSPGRIDIDPRRFLDHPEPRIRAASALAIGARDGKEVEVLLPGLDDGSMRVRKASAQALAGSHRGRELLLEVLKEGSVAATDAALSALTPVDDIGWEFGEWAKREAQRASDLSASARSLTGQVDSVVGHFLIDVLNRRSETLVGWVLQAMTTAATSDVMSIVERGVRSPDPETKDQAIEALETMGARTVLSVLLPLLEADPGAPANGARAALRGLSEDFDPWLRALALRCLATEIQDDLARLGSISATDQSDLVRQALPSFEFMPIEHLDTLNRMDRVIVLQQVPMFSELDPEDLDLVAGAMTEIQFEPRERIYSDGEPGEEMLVIVEGEAVVSKARDGSPQIIETYGAGDHVGELSLLRGGHRIADVDAGDSGLHGLVLSKADLLSILDERPAVAMGMLSTLATRLAEQT